MGYVGIMSRHVVSKHATPIMDSEKLHHFFEGFGKAIPKN